MEEILGLRVFDQWSRGGVGNCNYQKISFANSLNLLHSVHC